MPQLLTAAALELVIVPASRRLLILAAALACSERGGQRSSDSSASTIDSLPAHVGNALTQSFPGWRLARLAPAASAAVPQARQWISGDFDGDGRADYAVQIVRAAATSDSAQLVVALLATDSAFASPIIVSAGPENDIVYLSLASKGERIRNLDADLNGDSTYVLATDGIHINYAEKASTTCRWLGTAAVRFVCFTSGD